MKGVKWVSAALLAGGLVSTSASAAVISYFGYERDESSNIVVGGGLEWLQWTETTGRSLVDFTLNAGGEFDGWRLANLSEVSGLLLDFGVLDIAGGQTLLTAPFAAGESSVHDSFIELFGITDDGSQYSYEYLDPFAGAAAVFANGDFVSVMSDWQGTFPNSNVVLGGPHSAGYQANAETPFDSFNTRGLALVRDIYESPPSGEAPEPASIGLFSVLLAALSWRKRRV
ncbi:PEP-CTERM sorting domain-containing protein [Aliagarivorans taiwanensis]|uniref:PEP-CTERM sorting domain-containing protein n=1 Tax=Aliagarivorans taiwanensis TaxID=561966 RepID=UPI000418EBCE|nr:PEP-CTERM sorting domain-containing protein [Aliagarivorans taiwanensis]